MLGLHRFASGVATQLFRRVPFSNSSIATTATVHLADQKAAGTTESIAGTTDVTNKKIRSRLVEAAFESLKDNSTTNQSNEINVIKSLPENNIDERIINAKSVNSLLAITELAQPLSRRHALKIVSLLADWTSVNRASLGEFENDTRFLKLCRLLGRTVPKNNNNNNNNIKNNNNNIKRISGFRTDDLNTVLGVAGDDEAAKLIASISLPQMVKVMSALAHKRRRSTPLLRSLAFNISSSSDQLDLKQSADVLYAMASLNFQDSVLSAKICSDIVARLPKNTEKSAVVGSILTSLGILKYRDLDILESLTQWILKNCEICRPQDLSALFLTSSTLNFKSANFDDVRDKLVNVIVKEDFPKPIDWLNHVWALAMLGLASNSQLENILSSDFIEKLQKTNLTTTSKMKILNINSYVQLLAENYKGAILPTDSTINEINLTHSKSKQVLLNGLLDALKSLMPAKNYVQTSVDTKMGFIIDALCLFDDKRNPLSFDKEHSQPIKVALMVIDYHDVCHGTHRSASGIVNFSLNLLEKNGYKVVAVPYNEFNTSDKLLKRVQYLESKLKSIISRN